MTDEYLNGLSIETQAVVLAAPHDEAFGAVAPALHLSTTFERAADGSYPLGYEYSRDANPNRTQLEQAVATLEGGVEAAAFASGSAAAMTLCQTLSAGDHVVASDDMYFGVRQMLQRCFTRWGLSTTFVDTTRADNIAAAITPRTRLVLLETPSNPQLKVSDIRAAAEIAHDAGALLACDNTMATPVLQRPLDLGADLVIHSTTKYLCGSHDAMGGVVVTKRHTPLWEELRFLQKCCGAVPSPFASWLTLRSLPSLPHRVRRHSQSAHKIATFLSRHPRVEKVLHPMMRADSHVAEQMSGGGGVFSVCVRGDAEQAMSVAASTRIFRRATSFGGPESLIEHRASIEGPDTATPRNLLRLFIGLEDPEDLIADLEQALSS